MSSIEALKLGDIMSPRVRTVDPRCPIGEAARLMGEARVSCLVVVDGHQPVGIITEKDLLTLLNRQDGGQAAVNESMSSSLITATVDTDFHSAYSLLRRHRIRHLVVTDTAGTLVGIATATDFRNHLNQEVFSKIDRLDAVLDPVVSQLPPDMPLGQAIQHMVTSGWDYVLVVENQRPLGIFTERDIPRLWNAGVDLEAVPICQVMTAPLHCIPVSTQVAEASAAMARWKLRHLPVVDGEGHLLGVVSQNRMLEKLGLALFDEVWRERASLQEQNSDLAARLGLILEGSGVGVWELTMRPTGSSGAPSSPCCAENRKAGRPRDCAAGWT